MHQELTAEQIVNYTKDTFKATKFVGLFSGGKDSLVACHYLWKMGVLNEVLYCHTGINVKENFEFVLKTCNNYGWKLNVEYTQGRFTYEELVRRYGFPHQPMHQGTMLWLKWFSVRRFNRAHLDERICFVSGSRRKESRRRMRLKEAVRLVKEGERKDAPVLTASPLFDWTSAQVWNYIKENNLEVCPVYKTLHISGDCICGCFAESGEAELIATFHPEAAQYIAALEKKYGGRWGNHSSITGAMKQSSLSPFLEEIACQECFIDRQIADIQGKVKPSES